MAYEAAGPLQITAVFTNFLAALHKVPRESGWDEILDWTASLVRVGHLM